MVPLYIVEDDFHNSGIWLVGGVKLVREFMEIEDLATFRRVAEQSPLIIRRDPFLFAQYFAVMFFINLATLEREAVKQLFDTLKGKMVVIKNTVRASSVTEFVQLEEETKGE